jgi:Ca-activated chloride channel family protein
MKRWHLTFGLVTLALGAAWLAPRLAGSWRTEEVPTPPPPPIEDPQALIGEVVTPPAPPAPVVPLGHLVVDAGFDRSAILSTDQGERYLTITVSAPADTGRPVRRPVDLSVVLDTSGSMSSQGKIDQAKRAAKALAHEMGPGDTYSLTVFNDDALLVVPATPVDDPSRIDLAVDRILEGGSTNLYAGMDRGASEVRRTRREGAAARVVVLSDGDANVGVTDPNALVRFAADLAGDGVALSTVGVGLDFKEDLLQRLADVGGGSYDFVDDATELSTVFANELHHTAAVVATGTLVHVELPDGIAPVEVIGWDATRTDHGWDVFLGDVYAGETKKIVTRVRVDGPGLARQGFGCDGLGGTLGNSSCGPDVAATAHYADVVDAAEAVSTDDAEIRVTADRSVVEASLDRSRSIEATRAVGAQYLEMSTRAYERGDRAESRRLSEEGAQLLHRQSAALAAPVLENAASGLQEAQQVYDMHAPSDDEGRRAIKANKELYRDEAR